MNNRIFFQHPDLMRLLRVHEDVMTIMMNVLTAQQSAVDIDFTEQGVASINVKIYFFFKTKYKEISTKL